jgi:hypothetical protein
MCKHSNHLIAQKMSKTSPPKNKNDINRTKISVNRSLIESELPSPSKRGLRPTMFIGSFKSSCMSSASRSFSG